MVGGEAYPEGMGVEGAQAVLEVWSEEHELNSGMAWENGGLESRRGRWNAMCSGKMRRYMKEHQWRRRPPGLLLTLRHEGLGSKRD